MAVPRHAANLPEQQLLLHCARPGETPVGLTGDLARKVTNWDALADAAAYHGLAPMLYRTLASCPGPVPQALLGRLRDDECDSARRNLILTQQLLTILAGFQAEDIPALPLKGPALAESLYSDPLLRPFSDLDILLRRKDVPAAMQMLEREGYTLKPHLARLSAQTLMRLDFQSLFQHPRRGAVDIQWDTAPADFPFRFDPEILWRSPASIAIAGQPVLCPSHESLLLFLCVHGAKHVWSRLQWLGDVARLVGSPLDWAVALELAEETRCERPLLLGLLLAHDLLDAPVPPALIGRARAVAAVQERANQVAARLARIPPSEPRGAEFTAFSAGMAEGPAQRLRHYAALLKAPTDKELELFPLPESLFLLYYPLRLARLALKYIRPPGDR